MLSGTWAAGVMRAIAEVMRAAAYVVIDGRRDDQQFIAAVASRQMVGAQLAPVSA